MPMTETNTPFGEGSIIGERYKIESCLKEDILKSTYSCIDLYDDQKLLVLKTVNCSETLSQIPWDWSRNLSLLCRIRHPHFSRLIDFGVMENPSHLYFIEEWITGEDLFKGTEEKGTAELLRFLHGIFQAVRFLHTRGITHGRLTASNIFVVSGGDETLHFKLNDFGLSGLNHAGSLGLKPA
jgi:serine/threonine protein kinase